MKNKRIVKFLGVLISSLIVLGSSGQIFAKKVTKIKNINQEEKQKTYTNKERRKIKAEHEKQMQQKNAKAYENFNINKFKVYGFNLTVYFKNGSPILVFEHIKTKAKIVIIPTDTIEKTKEFYSFPFYIPRTSFNFNIYDENNKEYMDKFIGNAITSNFSVEELNGKKFKELGHYSVDASSPKLEINFGQHLENKEDYELLKKLFSSLKNPKIFKDNETFKLEKKRVLNYYKNYIKDPYASQTKASQINIKEIEKVTKNEILKFYENRINPSNLLVIKHAELKNYEEILKFLKFLDEEYLKYYNYKKVEIPPYGSKIKNFYETSKPTDYSNESGEKSYDYYTQIKLIFDLLKEKHPFLENFEFSKELLEKIKFKEYIKKLGYLDGDFSFYELRLYANNKNLFKEEKLKETGKKIFNYVLEKIKNIPRKELERKNYYRNFYNNYSLNYYNYLDNDNFVFASPITYKSDVSLRNVLLNNFLYFKDPFSKEVFEITPNNEIKDSEETLKNKIVKDFENINGIKKELKKTPFYNIEVFFKDKKQNKKHRYKLLIPLEIKNTKENKTLEYLAKCFLTRTFLNIKNYEYALPEDEEIIARFLKSYIGLYNITEKEISKETLKFYYNDFENSIKNHKITKEDFKETKKILMSAITNKKFVSSFNSGIEIIENFLKNGYEKRLKGENRNRFFKITKETPRSLMFNYYKYLLENCLF